MSAPSAEALAERLRQRGVEDPDELRLRLKQAIYIYIYICIYIYIRFFLYA